MPFVSVKLERMKQLANTKHVLQGSGKKGGKKKQVKMLKNERRVYHVIENESA